MIYKLSNNPNDKNYAKFNPPENIINALSEITTKQEFIAFFDEWIEWRMKIKVIDRETATKMCNSDAGYFHEWGNEDLHRKWIVAIEEADDIWGVFEPNEELSDWYVGFES